MDESDVFLKASDKFIKPLRQFFSSSRIRFDVLPTGSVMVERSPNGRL